MIIFSITWGFLDNFLNVQNRMIIFLSGYLKRPEEKMSLNINEYYGLNLRKWLRIFVYVEW